MTDKIYIIKRYNKGLSGSKIPGTAVDASQYFYTNLTEAKKICKEKNDRSIDFYFTVKEFIKKK